MPIDHIKGASVTTTTLRLYVFAQNANALAPAFQRLALELLLLAR